MEPRLKAEGHSSTEIVKGDGSVKLMFNGACFSHLWSGYEGMERLYLWFPEHECPLIAEYVNWVLNSDLFGEAFITKDFETGMVDGFEVNIHMPTNFLFSSMAALRYPWETDISRYSSNRWTYETFSKLGFTPKQCLFILTGAYYHSGKICPSGFNSNHLPIPRVLSWDKWKPETFTRQEGTMYQRASSIGVTEPWCGIRYPDGVALQETIPFPEDSWGGAKAMPLTDEIVEKLKEALKED